MIFQLAGIYGIKCFVAIGFVVVYQYSIEIYPTEARTTGTAINMGSGRVAGIISPLIFEAVVSMTGAFSVFFYLLIGCALLNFLLIPLLKYETFGMALWTTLTTRTRRRPASPSRPRRKRTRW